MPDISSAPETARTDSGKLAARGNAVGNKPARGIMGSPVSDDGGKEPRNGGVGGAFGKALRAAAGNAEPAESAPERGSDAPGKTGKRGGSRRVQRPAPKDGSGVPGLEDITDDMPEVRGKKPAKPQPKAPANATKRGTDYARQAPADETDDADGGTEAGESGTQDADGETEEARGGTDAGDGTDSQEGGTEADSGGDDDGSDPVLQSFAQRFGMAGLDKARAARDSLIDDVAATISGLGRAQDSPASSAHPNGQGRPQETASAPAQNPPAHSQQAGSGNRAKLSKEQIDLLCSNEPGGFGPEFKPVADLIVQLQEDVESHRSEFERGRAEMARRDGERANADFDRFIASKVKAGFKDLYGSQKDGLSNVHYAARAQLYQTAAAYQAAKARQGVRLSNEDALEAAFQFANRGAIERRARQQGAREVGRKVQARHRTLDAVGTGSGASSARGQNSENALSSSIRGFLGSARR